MLSMQLSRVQFSGHSPLTRSAQSSSTPHTFSTVIIHPSHVHHIIIHPSHVQHSHHLPPHHVQHSHHPPLTRSAQLSSTPHTFSAVGGHLSHIQHRGHPHVTRSAQWLHTHVHMFSIVIVHVSHVQHSGYIHMSTCSA